MFFGFIKKYGLKKILLASCDLLCALIAASLSIALTFNRDHAPSIFVGLLAEKILIFLLAAVIVIPIFRYYHLYKHKYFLKTGEQVLLILKGLLIDCVIIILIIFIVKTQEALHDSRLQVILFFSISFILISLYRIFIFRPAMRSDNLSENLSKFFTRRALAIGAGGLGRFFSESLSMKQHYHIDLVGFIDDDISKSGKNIKGIPILGSTNNLNNLVTEYDIDEIYVTIQKIDNKALLDLIEKCKLTTCQINLVSNHFDIINAKLDVNEFHDLKIISISSKASPLYSEKFKRIFDILISSILIAIISIPSLIISVLIKLTSSGTILYKTAVIGKDGKPFFWFKFRTMYEDNDPTIHKEHLKRLIVENHANQKLINDLRITKVGRILRKFSLDELPQLFNVFKGDMSLVGPRPCLPYEYEIFKDWHKLKYKVIPGMTGLAQITARNRKDVTFNDSVLLDLYYADNQSLWLDLKILFKTVPILMFGKGGV
ncbi:MAG: exopolysaccharide biosynthesis polyprenyl glycosylphosphotransferase [Ignavibacteria bacterium]|jgi:undecaprenyl-phosphate galactose phosphotransferase